MFPELHLILLRAAASLEIGTVVAATAAVHLGILRAAHARQLHTTPRRAAEIERSYHRGRILIGGCAAVLVYLAFAFDVGGEVFGAPSHGFRASAVGFLFLLWALIVGAWLRTAALPKRDASEAPHSRGLSLRR